MNCRPTSEEMFEIGLFLYEQCAFENIQLLMGHPVADFEFLNKLMDFHFQCRQIRYLPSFKSL